LTHVAFTYLLRRCLLCAPLQASRDHDDDDDGDHQQQQYDDGVINMADDDVTEAAAGDDDDNVFIQRDNNDNDDDQSASFSYESRDPVRRRPKYPSIGGIRTGLPRTQEERTGRESRDTARDTPPRDETLSSVDSMSRDELPCTPTVG